MHESCHAYELDMTLVWMIYVAHINKSCYPYIHVMSRLWINRVWHLNAYTFESKSEYTTASHRLLLRWNNHISHLYIPWRAKEAYKRGDILRKRSIILRSLLIVATPYVTHIYIPSQAEEDMLWFHVYKHVCTFESKRGLTIAKHRHLLWGGYISRLRFLLQKRPIILRSLPIVATPYAFMSRMWTCIRTFKNKQNAPPRDSGTCCVELIISHICMYICIYICICVYI